MRKQRIVPVFALLMVGFAIVAVRLVKLQAVETSMWMRESERSTVRFQSRPFARGWIMDRLGRPLARTEEVRDLTFRYRGWRRGTVAGQASHAWAAMGLERTTVPDAIERAETLLQTLGEVRISEISDLPSRLHRRDLGFYLQRLFGEDIWQFVSRELYSDLPSSQALREIKGFDQMLARSLERAAHEREALSDLAWAAGLTPEELIQGMERAGARAEQRVQGGLAQEQGDERERYRREQQLHSEFDDDPSKLVARVSYDTRTLVAIRQAELGGFGIHVEMRRIYPDDVRDVAPLIVGRVGDPKPEDIDRSIEHRVRLSDLASMTSLTPEELDEFERLRIQVREVDYKSNEERGHAGIEAAFEEVLRGKRGWIATSEQVDRDSVEREEPYRGLNIVLTLDTELQRAAETVLDQVFEQPLMVEDATGTLVPAPTAQWAGSIVLLDPRSGEVLAMATSPRPTRDEFEQRSGWLIWEDSWRRASHRAVDPGRSKNLPPPGSTFKPVSALAGLTSSGGVISRNTRFLCEGTLQVGNRTMGCLGYHGEIELEEALARSCNIYFYRLGRLVGLDALKEMAARFGFGMGRRSGLILDNEVLTSLGLPLRSGFHEAKPKFGEESSISAAMLLAIGQSPLDDVTPLQVATMVAGVGTGVLRPPMLIAEVEGYPPISARAGEPLNLPASALAVVRSGMAQVMDSELGTGRGLQALFKQKMPGLMGKIAAKTGTAQVKDLPDQSWFAGYLPRQSPRLAFAVMIEDCGLHGSEAAAPVFGLLLEQPAVQQYLRDEVLLRPGSLR